MGARAQGRKNAGRAGAGKALGRWAARAQARGALGSSGTAVGAGLGPAGRAAGLAGCALGAGSLFLARFD